MLQPLTGDPFAEPSRWLSDAPPFCAGRTGLPFFFWRRSSQRKRRAAGSDCRWLTTAASSRAGHRPRPQISELTICDAPSECDEVGVPKPFAVIENGNDLGGDPDQEDTFLSG
jgi:hypothetical protein